VEMSSAAAGEETVTSSVAVPDLTRQQALGPLLSPVVNDEDLAVLSVILEQMDDLDVARLRQTCRVLRDGVDACTLPLMMTSERIPVATVGYAQTQLSIHILIMGVEYPPRTLGSASGRTIALIKADWGVSPLFINILRFAPKSTPCSHLDRGHLLDMMRNDRRQTQWVKHLAVAVRKVYEPWSLDVGLEAQDKDSGLVVQQNNTPVIYISGKMCFEAWEGKKMVAFDHVRIISMEYRVHVYKVKDTDYWVIVMEDHPHPSSTLKFRGGRTKGWPLATGLVRLLVLERPPEKVGWGKDRRVLTEKASWVNADHDDIHQSLDAMTRELLKRTTDFESRLREWFKKSGGSQECIEDCVSLFSSNITAVEDDMNAFFLRVDEWYKWLGDEVDRFVGSSQNQQDTQNITKSKLFAKLFSHYSMVATFAGDHNRSFFLRAKEWFKWLEEDMDRFVTLFSHRHMVCSVAGDDDRSFESRAKEWYVWLGNNMDRFVTLFSKTFLAAVIAGDHNRSFFLRAKEWFKWLEEDMDRFVTLFSHNLMVCSVAGDDDGSFFSLATQKWYVWLEKDMDRFVTLFSKTSFVDHTGNGDENGTFFSRVDEWYEWLGDEVERFWEVWEEDPTKRSTKQKDTEKITKSKLFVMFFSHNSIVRSVAGDDDGSFFSHIKKWYKWCGEDMVLFAKLFSNNAMPFAIASNHDILSRADEWVGNLGGNKELFAKLCSRGSFPSAVGGDGHKLFKERALQLREELNNDDKFATIMHSDSILSRLKNKDDEDFFKLICKYMPRLEFPSIYEGLERWFVSPLGETFFELVSWKKDHSDVASPEVRWKSPEVRWKKDHTPLLRGRLEQKGLVTPNNLVWHLREICGFTPATTTATPPAGVGGASESAGTLTFLEAAAAVLQTEHCPLPTAEICRIAIQRNLIKCRSKKPEATMATALSKDWTREASVFTRPVAAHGRSPSLFGLKEWKEAGSHG
jgi:hypothetical protein